LVFVIQNSPFQLNHFLGFCNSELAISTQAPVVIPKAEVVQGNKQRRTRKSKDIPPTDVVTKHESDDCVIIEQSHGTKPTCNNNVVAAGNKAKPQLLTAKPHSLTTSLTSRSAVALRGFKFDDEMTEAEEDRLPNIDGGDLDNQLAVVEYVEDIYKFYHRTEQMSCVPDYMPRQREINAKMRAVLINWLIEVHYRFGLMPETLYLTTNLLDRYVSTQLASWNLSSFFDLFLSKSTPIIFNRQRSMSRRALSYQSWERGQARWGTNKMHFFELDLKFK
jgi:hypothetical protein